MSIEIIANFACGLRRWVGELDWRAISNATIPTLIAGLLLKLLGAV